MQVDGLAEVYYVSQYTDEVALLYKWFKMH